MYYANFQILLFPSAAARGYVEIVRLLANHMDSPNEPNEDGWTPIHSAAMEGQIDVIKVLLPYTDNPNIPDNIEQTPIGKRHCLKKYDQFAFGGSTRKNFVKLHNFAAPPLALCEVIFFCNNKNFVKSKFKNS